MDSPSQGVGAGLASTFDVWLQVTLRKTGMLISPNTCVTTMVCLGILTGVSLWIAESPPVFVGTGAIGSVIVGIVSLRLIASRREKQFSAHFPAAVELLARSVRAGESLEDSLTLAAESAQDPVKTELLHCAKQIRMGRSAASVMGDLAKRFPLMNVRIFAHIISVHRSTGGRLSETLERLAKVIRQRTEYLQKIRTLTGMGRFAALAIGYLGVFVLIYLSLLHPEYIQKLWATPLGQKMAVYALVSELIGIVWVALTLRSEE